MIDKIDFEWNLNILENKEWVHKAWLERFGRRYKPIDEFLIRYSCSHYLI